MELNAVTACLFGASVFAFVAADIPIAVFPTFPTASTPTTTTTRAIYPSSFVNFTVNSASGTIILSNYTLMGSMPLTPQQTLQCQCQGPFSKILKVCGTNGVTYPTACALNSAMQTNNAIGLRCGGACPCPNFSTQAAGVGGCNANLRLPVSPKPANLKFRQSNLKVFCLTDGTEEVRATIFCRLAQNTSLGIRAMGSCQEFAGYNCPARLLQQVPMYDPNSS